MSTTNPLTAPATVDLARLARLYVLTRDAYLSPSPEMAAKLDALTGLRRRVLSSPDADAAVPVDGVRLVEMLRWRLAQAGPAVHLPARHLVVADTLCSTRPPVTGVWARPPESLIADVSAYVEADLSVVDLRQLARHHDRCRRRLVAASRLRRRRRGREPLPDPIATLADATSEVSGVGAPAALSTAVVLLAGGSPPPALAGSAVLERMPNPYGRSLDGYVGTAVARRCLQALIHELATLDTVGVLDPGLRPALAGGLRALRADLGSTVPSTAVEELRLRGAARAVEALRRRGDRPGSPAPRPAPTAPGGRGASQHR